MEGKGGEGEGKWRRRGHLVLGHCPALVATQECRGRAGVRTRVQPGPLAVPVKSHGPKTQRLNKNPMKTTPATEPWGISSQSKGLAPCLGAGTVTSAWPRLSPGHGAPCPDPRDPSQHWEKRDPCMGEPSWSLLRFRRGRDRFWERSPLAFSLFSLLVFYFFFCVRVRVLALAKRGCCWI